MKIENCIKCECHDEYKYSRILCKFSNNINCMTTYSENNTANVFVTGCPKDK